MDTVILGGAGFVGLNVAQALLARGCAVTILDRVPPPAAAREAFAALPGRLTVATGDATDSATLQSIIVPGIDALVLGAAITADAARDAADPEGVLAVNLLSQVPALRAAREAGVRRVVNLSSAAAYGSAGERVERLDEAVAADPVGLYAITKFASERVVARLGVLWGLDVVSVRLSGVFGPWERATGARDTLSPHFQLTSLAESGRPALLARPGLRDWIYAPDVGEAVSRVIAADRLAHPAYNVSAPRVWSVLDWGRHVGRHDPGFVCRLAEPGEGATVDLHASVDRAPLATDRLRDELGWTAQFGLADSADHYLNWRRTVGPGSEERA